MKQQKYKQYRNTYLGKEAATDYKLIELGIVDINPTPTTASGANLNTALVTHTQVTRHYAAYVTKRNSVIEK